MSAYQRPTGFQANYGQQQWDPMQAYLQQRGANIPAGFGGAQGGGAGWNPMGPSMSGDAPNPYPTGGAWPGGPASTWQQYAQQLYGQNQPGAQNPYGANALQWQAPSPVGAKSDTAADTPAPAAPTGPTATPAATPAAPATGTGGTFGSTYRDPGGGWNPISLLDARNGFDGTAVDGWYNAQADRPNWMNGPNTERDRDRVWRWTMDDMRARGVDFANTQAVNTMFLNNVARLKRDYLAPENVQRGLNWAQSAFAGYDRMPGATGQGATPGAGQPGTPATGPATPAAPAAPTGPAAPASPAAAAAPATAAALGQAQGPQGPWSTQQYDLFQKPEFQESYILRQLGYDPSRPGVFGQSILDHLKGQVGALNQFSQFTGAGNGGGTGISPQALQGLINQTLSGYTQPGGDAYGRLRQMAQGIQGNPAFQGFLKDEPDDLTQFRNLQNLQVMLMGGASGLAQSATQQRGASSYQDFLLGGWDKAGQGQAAPQSYFDWLQQNGGGMQRFGFPG